jgi:hypothetical protein
MDVMKHVSASANDSTTPTVHVESPDITSTLIEKVVDVSNFDDIKRPSNKKKNVQDVLLHIQSMAENSVLLV